MENYVNSVQNRNAVIARNARTVKYVRQDVMSQIQSSTNYVKNVMLAIANHQMPVQDVPNVLHRILMMTHARNAKVIKAVNILNVIERNVHYVLINCQ